MPEVSSAVVPDEPSKNPRRNYSVLSRKTDKSVDGSYSRGDAVGFK